MKYAYYPGCSLKGTAIDFHTSTLSLAKRLGIDLVEMEDWVCCGASPIHQRNPVLSTSVANLLLSLADGISPNIAVLCAACYNNMKRAEVQMNEDGETRNLVEEVSGVKFNPETKVQHLLDILLNDYGVEKIKEKVVKPLNGLKVACYYGCLLTRPPEVAFDDVEQPTTMEKILEAAGAEVVDWTHKLDCCGVSHAVPRTDVVLRLVNDILGSAAKAGADAVICACPLCQSNLDVRQDEISGKFGNRYNLPPIYFTQLLSIACGADGKEVMLDKSFINSTQLLTSKGLL